jgi:hypothetical protein
LEVFKSAVREFDQIIIALASSRSYKSSNNLTVNSENRIRVFRESTYDSEMYQILVNWLKIVHNFEITGQWHMEQVCNDGENHHLYCDLTIKKNGSTYPEAVIEIIATASIANLKKHFEQIFLYAEKLQPSEVWVLHFSRGDNVTTNPFWPCKSLQDKGLNVVHFWHDNEFKNVRMSSRLQIAPGHFNEIIDEKILP